MEAESEHHIAVVVPVHSSHLALSIHVTGNALQARSQRLVLCGLCTCSLVALMLESCWGVQPAGFCSNAKLDSHEHCACAAASRPRPPVIL